MKDQINRKRCLAISFFNPDFHCLIHICFLFFFFFFGGGGGGGSVTQRFQALSGLPGSWGFFLLMICN